MALPYNEHVIEFWYINPFFLAENVKERTG